MSATPEYVPGDVDITPWRAQGNILTSDVYGPMAPSENESLQGGRSPLDSLLRGAVHAVLSIIVEDAHEQRRASGGSSRMDAGVSCASPEARNALFNPLLDIAYGDDEFLPDIFLPSDMAGIGSLGWYVSWILEIIQGYTAVILAPEPTHSQM
jgi:hypothetical protein